MHDALFDLLGNGASFVTTRAWGVVARAARIFVTTNVVLRFQAFLRQTASCGRPNDALCVLVFRRVSLRATIDGALAQASHLFKKRLMHEAVRVIVSHGQADVVAFLNQKSDEGAPFDAQRLYSAFTMDSFMEIAFGQQSSSVFERQPVRVRARFRLGPHTH